MNNITLYVVPDLFKVSGGPRTRIKGISEALLLQSPNNRIIKGKGWVKLRATIKASRTKVVYVESSTNRISGYDFCSLLIWRLKAKMIIVYIRDVYIELFPEEYKGFRKSITKYGNYLSNYFYLRIANKLAFPTIEMGEEFFKSHPNYKKSDFFPLPPGTFLFKSERKVISFEMGEMIKILYLGASSYVNSGFERFIEIMKNAPDTYEFHILTGEHITDRLEEEGIDFSRVFIKSLNHNEVFDYIISNEIKFAIHTRPRNLYDDITIPIKFMDFISIGLPVITMAHKPIQSMLGEDYPFYINELSVGEVNSIVDRCTENSSIYESVIDVFKDVKLRLLYEEQVKLIQANG